MLRVLGFESGIFHNEPDALQDHWCNTVNLRVYREAKNKEEKRGMLPRLQPNLENSTCL